MRDTYRELSIKYPHFVYRSYDYKQDRNGLEGTFVYEIMDAHGDVAFEFCTSWAIAAPANLPAQHADVEALVYSLGMVEAISYWKLTCASRLTVACGRLDDWQVQWWRKLFRKGLSEFFYLNDIADWDEQSLHIVSEGVQLPQPASQNYDESKVIVPIGGGKDSITSVEVLRAHKAIVPIVMNPIQASQQLIEYHNFAEVINIRRRLDPQIIRLNAEGFLNGHIPFSAVLSMYTMLAGRLYGIADIALSNESSANEPTILGTDINHQYSKSLEYEKDINEYVSRYLDAGINYFSLLRPLNEYQITKIFAAADTDLHQLFRSCNRGSKQGIWCCKCPKCLFTYIMMHAHLPLASMLDIYGSDLLEDSDLEGYFLSLTGQRTEKPFECVGTIEEVNTALSVIKQKRSSNLPKLYEHWSDNLTTVSEDGLLAAYEQSQLTEQYEFLLKQKLAAVV